jgi:hypothetical protein
MENVMLDNATIDIEAQFAKYQEFSTRKIALEERISRAEDERPSIKDRIFQKVLQEYRNELQILDHDLSPLEKKINDARLDLENKITDIDIQTADFQDKIDEIAFRHRVGEFSDSEMAEKQVPIETEYEELTQLGIGYVQTLENLDMAQSEPAKQTGETIDEQPAAPEPKSADEEAPAVSEKETPEVSDAPASEKQFNEFSKTDMINSVEPAVTEANESSPVDEKLELDPAEDEESLVDPSKWVGEFVDGDFLRAPETHTDDDGATEEKKNEDAAPKNDNADVVGFSELDLNENKEKPDPLSELADPSADTELTPESAKDPADENSGEQSSDASHETDQDTTAGDLPVLSITKGAGSGKKLPLLPMTMTLGRELDNNIELKDPDVARYHARITYHAGDYVVHDLEGSSGTFVNGEKISKATLSPGDTIRTGDTELKFDLE